MNVAFFIPEQIVHDRYLYLPLLGFLLLIFPPLAELLEKFIVGKAEFALLATAVVLSFPLALKTFFYILRLGMLYAEVGRKTEARQILEDYLKITAAMKDKNTLAERAQASEILKQLR